MEFILKTRSSWSVDQELRGKSNKLFAKRGGTDYDPDKD